MKSKTPHVTTSVIIIYFLFHDDDGGGDNSREKVADVNRSVVKLGVVVVITTPRR